MGALIAFTEGERLGLLGLIGVCITAAASVETQSEKIDGLREDIAAVRDSAHQIAKRVDHAHERIDHQSWLRPDR